ncbi:MAG TPA: VCBS repeat-containing protein, partial [Opitutus sp.]|nr:VCBS repeat-containing protein [Opitutus sp.]
MAVGRFDGDGEDDLALGGGAGDPGRLFSNLGQGQFLAYGSSLFGDAGAVADGPLATLDVVADGDLDLLATKAGIAASPDDAIYRPRIWLNDGTGRFTAGPADLVPSLRSSVGAVAVADFEHTGRAGVFVGGRVVPGRYPEAAPSALLASRDGKLVDVTAEVAPQLAAAGMVTAALWSDVDADGWVDLLVAFDWGPVRCFRNIEGRRLEDASERLGFTGGGTGWWRSLAAGDFNGDGRLDYAAGNVGLNTLYRASAKEPAVMYAGVVLEGSAPQLVEAQAKGGRWYPLRAREVLTRAFPSLAKRFPTAESFATAELGDVFPGDAL